MLRFLSSRSNVFLSFSNLQHAEALQLFTRATCSTLCLARTKAEKLAPAKQSNDAAEVLSKWGCNSDDLARIFTRCPALRNTNAAKVQSKLSQLSTLGLGASDLVKIVICRPRFFSCKIKRPLEERLPHLLSLFETKDVLQKAIVRNPSLLACNDYDDIKATFELYEGLGVKKRDLIQMILLRPTILSRTSLNSEKLEYIDKIGVSKDSKMYKYVVTLIGVSRVDTIREKVGNLMKFGLSEDEIFGLLARSPPVITLSTDKVQRNMIFVLGTMKLDAKIILRYPFLLYANIDKVLKPRVLLVMKVRDVNSKLEITQSTIIKALRMTEERFLQSFVRCHDKEVANELMEFYRRTKQVKRLAESSKKCVFKGFPF